MVGYRAVIAVVGEGRFVGRSGTQEGWTQGSLSIGEEISRKLGCVLPNVPGILDSVDGN